MLLIRKGISVGGQKIISRQNMRAAQLSAALKNVRRGSAPHILNLTVRTIFPTVQLCKLGTQAYYRIASSNAIGFDAFLEFVSRQEGKLFKAWLIYEGKEGIEHEITFSDAGISLDGALLETSSLQESIEFVVKEAPPLIREQKYSIGLNAGAVIIGEPREHGLGIETKLQNTTLSTLAIGSEGDHFMPGATSLKQFDTIAAYLFNTQNFLSLEFPQPALSVAVREAHVYHDRVRRIFSWECVTEKVAPKIERNLLNGVLGSDTNLEVQT